MTLVVNLYGGPGTGKSTTAALAFGKLKAAGYNAELVTEFAKELVWEKRDGALSAQSYILGKQSYRVHRLLGKVDVVVTDSPILLSLIYSGEWEALNALAVDIHRGWNTLDIFLQRNPEVHPYNPLGRYQTEEQAAALDEEILRMLSDNSVPLTVLFVEGERTADYVVELVAQRLAS